MYYVSYIMHYISSCTSARVLLVAKLATTSNQQGVALGSIEDWKFFWPFPHASFNFVAGLDSGANGPGPGQFGFGLKGYNGVELGGGIKQNQNI